MQEGNGIIGINTNTGISISSFRAKAYINGKKQVTGEMGYYETDKNRRCGRACTLP